VAGNILLKGNAWTQMLSTELNSLASVTAAAQSTGTNPAFDNSTGLWLWGDFELDVTFGSSPTAGKTVDLYLIPLAQAGGSTFWDANTTTLPSQLYIGSWPVRNVNTAQVIGFRGVPLPPQKFVLLLNNGTDQAFPASGTKVYFYSYAESYT
jgi:hypothetical protein